MTWRCIAIALLLLAIGGVLFLLGGCAPVIGAAGGALANIATTVALGSDQEAAGETEETAELEAADEQARGLMRSLMDKLIAAETPKDRALRVCFGSLILIETLVDEIYRFGGSATDVAGLVLKSEMAIARAKGTEDSPWFETEMSDIAVDMRRALMQSLLTRGQTVSKDLATSTSIFGISRGLLTSGRKVIVKREKVTAMLKDIDHMLTAPRAPIDELWEICEARVHRNRAGLEAALTRS